MANSNLLVDELSRNWLLIAIRGLAAIVFGVSALLVPAAALFVLIMLFAAYAIVDGIAATVFGLRAGWGTMLLVGALSLVAGAIAILNPLATAVALLYLFAIWSIIRGVSEIAASIRLRKEIDGEWLMALGGVFSIIFGLLLLAYPGAGMLTVIWLIAVSSIIFGFVSLSLGFRLRSHGQWHEPISGRRVPA